MQIGIAGFLLYTIKLIYIGIKVINSKIFSITNFNFDIYYVRINDHMTPNKI